MNTRPYPAKLRIIHWLMACCVFGLVITIFLRLNWMNKFHVANIAGDFLQEKNIPLTQDELIVLAKKIRKPMWDWHINLGYALTALVCMRMLLIYSGTGIPHPFKKNISAWQKVQYSSYLIFYACFILSLLSGLGIVHGNPAWKENLEHLHELSLFYLVPYLLIHLAGVLMAEFSLHPGIVSEMINGKGKK